MILKTSSVSSNSPARERKRPATSDVVGTALLGFVGAVAFVMGLGYGFMEDEDQVGPGFLPVLTGGFIFVASAAEIARMYLASGRGGGTFLSAAESAEEEAKAAAGRAGQSDADAERASRAEAERNRAIAKVFALLLAALLLVPVTGLLLSLTAMVLAIMLWVERKPVVSSVAISLAGLGIVYLLFVQILGVPLPQGMLGLI